MILSVPGAEHVAGGGSGRTSIPSGTSPPAESAHTLVVHDDPEGRDYALLHPDDCPYDHDDSFVVGGKFYRCGEGEIWYGGGEYCVADIEKLPAGRYPVRAAYSHTPSTPNGPEEWDAWLEVERGEDQP